jgi:hypothetical protein
MRERVQNRAAGVSYDNKLVAVRLDGAARWPFSESP